MENESGLGDPAELAERGSARFVVPAHAVTLEGRRHDMRGYSVVYHAFDRSGSQSGGQVQLANS